ncbi:MAG: IPT/TIG domain-containing protein [Chloroflexi bacterium]|nr:IPT/TIG domain-containing protein [Chloroflexota bacterium]
MTTSRGRNELRREGRWYESAAGRQTWQPGRFARLVALVVLLTQVSSSLVPPVVSAGAAPPSRAVDAVNARPSPVDSSTLRGDAPGRTPLSPRSVAKQDACDPRPAVRVSVVPLSETGARVDVTAGAGTLGQLRIDRTDGAEVIVAGQSGRTGSFTVPIVPPAPTTSFVVRRVATGTAATVHLAIFDGCGEWRTFVGGGAGTWTVGAEGQPSPTPVPPTPTSPPAPGAPTVTALQPSSGASAGSTVVTISGTGFSTSAGATTVTFGTVAATSVICASAVSCTVTAPGGIGPVDVRVTVGGATSATSNASTFAYLGSITSVSPTSGPVSGGTLVTISGTGFSTEPARTLFTFGDLAARDVVCGSPTSCTAKTPPHLIDEVVGVAVYVGSGTPGPVNPAVRFTYGAPNSGGPGSPTVTSLYLPNGPATGGSIVKIIGTGFSTTAGATGVRFGSAAAADVSCVSDTVCTATSPAGGGVVSVSVTVGGQTSAASAASAYSYESVPTVTGISAHSGDAGGGLRVTVTGTNFSTTPGATRIFFGTNQGTSVACSSTTTCAATIPPGKNTVDVSVQIVAPGASDMAADAAPGQTSAPDPRATFKYSRTDVVPPSLATSTTSVTIKVGTIRATWGGVQPEGNDWISLMRVGAADDDTIQTYYVGSESGFRDFNAPIDPGYYEFRLYRRKDGVTTRLLVTSKTISARLPLEITPTSPRPGETATVLWQNSQTVYYPNGKEWIGLYAVNAADNSPIETKKVPNAADGPLTGLNFLVPTLPGTNVLEFRIFTDDAHRSGTMQRIGASPTFTVQTAQSNCGDYSRLGVYVFSGYNWTGNCTLFTSDVGTFTGTNVGHDAGSSVYVNGSGWVATLYSDVSFTGTSVRLSSSSTDLRGVGFDDRASAIRVGASNCGSGAEEGVYVYDNYSWTGGCSKFTADTATFDGTALGHDTASAIRFIGSGWKATLYSEPNYGGASTEFTSDSPDFSGTQIGHDRASSIRVTRYANTSCDGTPGVYVYDGYNYSGLCARLTADTPDLSMTPLKDGHPSSIQFVGSDRYTATIFTQINYGGAYASFVSDVNQFDSQRIRGYQAGAFGTTSMNNQGLSVRVHRRVQWDNPVNFEQLDYGIYWIRCGACRFGTYNQGTQASDPYKGRTDAVRAVPGQNDDYYDPSKPTIIYVHGLAPWSSDNPSQSGGRQDRERYSWDTGDATGEPVDGVWDTAQGYLNDGWNVGIFYWNQFSDDENWLLGQTDNGGVPYISEAKVWSATHPIARGMRWRKKDGSYATGAETVNVPASELLLQAYVANLTGNTSGEIRLAGHSLGNQMISRLTERLRYRIYDDPYEARLPAYLLPKRVTLLDPYYTDAMAFISGTIGAFDRSADFYGYLPNKLGTGDMVASFVPGLRARGVLFEYYQSSDIAPQHRRVADQMTYTRLYVDYQGNIASGAHGEAIYWYFTSRYHSRPREYVWQGIGSFGSFQPTGAYSPSAQTSNSDLAAMENCSNGAPCYWWTQIDPKDTRTNGDDKFERKNR